jgi:hypothetical protein
MTICTNVILLVFLNIIQRAQSGLGLRQSGDRDDEHPGNIEDVLKIYKNMQGSKTQKWKKLGRRHAKK